MQMKKKMCLAKAVEVKRADRQLRSRIHRSLALAALDQDRHNHRQLVGRRRSIHL